MHQLSSNRTTVECRRIKVFARIRPLLPSEIAAGGPPCISVGEDGKSLCLHNDSPITFHGVFLPDSSVQAICTTLLVPPIRDIVRGYHNALLFYGQTGSGKTHTVQQVVPTFIQSLFSLATSEKEKYEFIISMECVQIYLEKITDLLDPDRVNLQIREFADTGVFVRGAKEVVLQNASEFQQKWEDAIAQRVSGFTAMNVKSSRSHMVLTINVKRRKLVKKEQFCNELAETTAGHSLSPNASDVPMVTCGQLHFVDLAGCERLKRSGSAGVRQQEAIHINQSLSSLGAVIQALADPRTTHIPYRDSKLTRMLQESLGGGGTSAIVVCLSPWKGNIQESRLAISFGRRAMDVFQTVTTWREIDGKTRMMEVQEWLEQRVHLLESRLQLMEKDGSNEAADESMNKANLECPKCNALEIGIKEKNNHIDLLSRNALVLKEEYTMQAQKLQDALERAQNDVAFYRTKEEGLTESETAVVQHKMTTLSSYYDGMLAALQEQLQEAVQERDASNKEVLRLQTSLEETHEALKHSEEKRLEEYSMMQAALAEAQTQICALKDEASKLAVAQPGDAMASVKELEGLRQKTLESQLNENQLKSTLRLSEERCQQLEADLGRAKTKYERLAQPLLNIGYSAEGIAAMPLSELQLNYQRMMIPALAVERLGVELVNCINDTVRRVVEESGKRLGRFNEKMLHIHTRLCILRDRVASQKKQTVRSVANEATACDFTAAELDSANRKIKHLEAKLSGEQSSELATCIDKVLGNPFTGDHCICSQSLPDASMPTANVVIQYKGNCSKAVEVELSHMDRVEQTHQYYSSIIIPMQKALLDSHQNCQALRESILQVVAKHEREVTKQDQGHLSSVEEKNRQISELAEQLSIARSNLNDAISEIKRVKGMHTQDMQTTADANMATIAKLRNQLLETQAAVNELQVDILKAKEDFQHNVIHLEQKLEAGLVPLRAHIGCLIEQKLALEEKLHGSEGKIGELCQSLLKREAVIEQQRRHLSSMEQSIQQLNHRHALAIKDSMRNVDALEGKLQKSEMECMSLTNRCTEVQEENALLVESKQLQADELIKCKMELELAIQERTPVAFTNDICGKMGEQSQILCNLHKGLERRSRAGSQLELQQPPDSESENRQMVHVQGIAIAAPTRRQPIDQTESKELFEMLVNCGKEINGLLQLNSSLDKALERTQDALERETKKNENYRTLFAAVREVLIKASSSGSPESKTYKNEKVIRRYILDGPFLLREAVLQLQSSQEHQKRSSIAAWSAVCEQTLQFALNLHSFVADFCTRKTSAFLLFVNRNSPRPRIHPQIHLGRFKQPDYHPKSFLQHLGEQVIHNFIEVTTEAATSVPPPIPTDQWIHVMGNHLQTTVLRD